MRRDRWEEVALTHQHSFLPVLGRYAQELQSDGGKFMLTGVTDDLNEQLGRPKYRELLVTREKGDAEKKKKGGWVTPTSPRGLILSTLTPIRLDLLQAKLLR